MWEGTFNILLTDNTHTCRISSTNKTSYRQVPNSTPQEDPRRCNLKNSQGSTSNSKTLMSPIPLYRTILKNLNHLPTSQIIWTVIQITKEISTWGLSMEDPPWWLASQLQHQATSNCHYHSSSCSQARRLAGVTHLLPMPAQAKRRNLITCQNQKL